jgi:RNA polymerase sigma-70 factor (ECF subfamily)
VKASDAIAQELLVLRWRRGDRSAIDEIFARWNPKLLFYVRRLADDEQAAMDVLQQTWMQVVRRLSTLKEPQRLNAWLYTIARNAAMAHHRNGRHVGTSELLIDVPADEPLLPLEDVEAVHAALPKLSHEHREVLTLFFLQDLTLDQIAQVLGAPRGTVKSRLHYAKHAMRKIMTDQEQ